MYIKLIVSVTLFWPLNLFNCSVTHTSNPPIKWQQLNAFKHGQNELLKFKLSIRIGKKCDLSGFEHGCWYQTGWLEYFRNC